MHRGGAILQVSGGASGASVDAARGERGNAIPDPVHVAAAQTIRTQPNLVSATTATRAPVMHSSQARGR